MTRVVSNRISNRITGAVMAAGAAAAVVFVAGCDSGSDTSTPETGSGNNQQQFEVVSFELPADLPVEFRPGDGESGAKTAKWVHETDGLADCVVTVSVQGDVPATMPAYKAFLETTGPTSIDDDPDAPQGADGVIANYSGTERSETGADNPFTSKVRTLITDGKSKLTITTVANDSIRSRCNPDRIASSLQWNGNEA